jgi:hypothetical protein
MAKLLEDNRRMGRRRVDSWRLSRSLDEVAWVFTNLCSGISRDRVDAGLCMWDGSACGRLVTNMGLPKYAESFAFNLTGASLPTLKIHQLAQLGVTDYDEQKRIMNTLRALLHAYERRDAVAKAQANWMFLLSTHGGLFKNEDDQTGGDLEDADGQEAEGDQDATNASVVPRLAQTEDVVGQRSAGKTGVVSMRASRTPRGSPSPRKRLVCHSARTKVDFDSVGAASQRTDLSGLLTREASERTGQLPAIGSSLDSSPRARTQHLMPTPLPTIDGMMGAGVCTTMDAKAISNAADAVGQPTVERDGAGILPVGAWLTAVASDAASSPRRLRAGTSPRAGSRQISSMKTREHETRPDHRRGKALRRDEKRSRRILESLADGGKLPTTPEAAERIAFVVPAKNEYNFKPTKGADMQKELTNIRRRLGVRD